MSKAALKFKSISTVRLPASFAIVIIYDFSVSAVFLAEAQLESVLYVVCLEVLLKLSSDYLLQNNITGRSVIAELQWIQT